MSYKKIFLLGHVGSDPEIRVLAQGMKVANFSVAIQDRKMVNGTLTNITEWYRIDAMQKGETGLVTSIIDKFVKKGSQVMIEGSPQQDTWTDKQTGAKRNGFKVRIGHPGSSLQLCARPGSGNGMPGTPGYEPATTAEALADVQPGEREPLSDDDIPF